jgi:hypothetical protein
MELDRELERLGLDLQTQADEAERRLAEVDALRKTFSERIRFVLEQQRRVMAANNALAKSVDALSVWAAKGIGAMTFSTAVPFIPEPVKDAVANEDSMRLRLLDASAEIADMRPVSGIYFLIRGDAIVYVGQSVDIISRLAAHNADPSKDFNRFAYVPCQRQDLNAVEEFFIKLFQPEHNRRGIAVNTAVPAVLKKSIQNRVAAAAANVPASLVLRNDAAA